MTARDDGRWLHAFATQLYPLCRSITGDGLRQTLRMVHAKLPLKIREVPSGSRVFDWQVPDEWNIEAATLCDPAGRVIADFARHNLELLNYAEPGQGTIALTELQSHLYSLPAHPEWVPYRTSYYRRHWGFCLPDRLRQSLPRGRYGYDIRGSLKPGALSYGECLIRGRQRTEVLLFTHACHPSLANDNVSGIAVLTALGRWLAGKQRRYSYRLVYAPGTIGSLCWLRANEKRLGNIRHGLVLGLLGDSAPLTYKLSRQGTHEIDAVATQVLAEFAPGARTIPFEPYGYDERQFCSPAFNLPMGRLTRSTNDGYAEYHSSADNLGLITPGALAQSLAAVQHIVMSLEESQYYLNRKPRGEPRLGKRGLYGALGGASPRSSELAMLWVLNQSDGGHSLQQIAHRSGIGLDLIREAARQLQTAGLLRSRQ